MSARVSRAVLAVGAIGLALGTAGGAHAADLITGKQIKNGTVTSADLRDATLIGLDLRDAGLTVDDFAGDVTGPQGPTGDQGLPGAPGIRFAGYAANAAVLVPGKQVSLSEPECDPGLHAVAGGYVVIGDDQLNLLDSAPAGNPTPQSGRAWAVRVKNPTNTPASYIPWAICAEVRP